MDRHSSRYFWIVITNMLGKKHEFVQAIAQKGFDERHAYIGGMFGWATSQLNQRPTKIVTQLI